MNVWIINEYAGSPRYGMEFRHYYLGKELVRQGYNVTIISSSYSHLFRNPPNPGFEIIDGVRYLWLDTLNYGASHSKLRVLKWLLFTFKLFFLPVRLSRPDLIIVSPMAPFPVLPAYFLKKCYKSKLIFEVKDIWPMSLIELGKFSPRHPLIILMSIIELFALKKCDELVSNLQNYGEYIKERGVNREFTLISNGIDLDEMSVVTPLSEDIKSLLPKDHFIVGYTGTVGSSDTLDILLKASELISCETGIAFVIVGDGIELEHLKSKYRKSNNIYFIPPIPKNQIQSMLSLFDVCYLGWKKQNIYKYGTSANKLYDYMYSGKPILHAFDGQGDVVKAANCGLTVQAENPDAVAVGILELYNMTEKHRQLIGFNGRNYVLENYAYKNIARRYCSIFESN